jgi:adenylate cyclase
MNNTLEIEKTYLAKSFPVSDLTSLKSKKIIDVYIPGSFEKPTIRLRQNGDHFEITKKVQVNPSDASTHQEFTIPLSQEEFEALSLGGKVVEKTRYYFEVNGYDGELDVFDGELKGLVLVDFEFDSQDISSEFIAPEFCGADVTQEKFIAGKNLAGKAYADIEKELARFEYKELL